MAPHRRCAKCNTEKPASSEFFHLSNKRGCGGLNPRCKECRQSESRAYYEKNTARIRQNVSKWQAENQDAVKAIKRRSAEKHFDVKRERDREYKKRNRKELTRRDIERRKAKELSDPGFRLSRLMSRRMWMSLRKAKDGWSWEGLVGYSRQDLKEHLERQFTKGMTWAAFAAGLIHIDHIIPVSVFDYKSPCDDGFRACWALPNLRPLWASDNLSKGSKVVTLL
jgi:hypothetical protein